MTRHPSCRPDATLDNCHAILLELEPRPPSVGRTLTVWRHGPRYCRPEKPGQRFSELRRGDFIVFRGERGRVISPAIHR